MGEIMDRYDKRLRATRSHRMNPESSKLIALAYEMAENIMDIIGEEQFDSDETVEEYKEEIRAYIFKRLKKYGL